MKERPIIFSSPMVRAILDGRKSQTRRIVKKQISDIHKFQGWIIGSTDKKRDGCASWGIGEGALIYDLVVARCPYGKPGDRLWVRETWQGPLFYDEIPEDWNSDKYKTPEYCYYKASGDSCDFTDSDDNFVERWSPSIHMPRWASRILLEVTNVRVERLHDISEEDAKAEGSYVCDYFGRRLLDQSSNQGCYKWGYRSIWESLNGSGSWHLNPFVWVVEFRTLEIARAAA